MTSQLILCNKEISVYCENHVKHVTIGTLYRENEKFSVLNVEVNKAATEFQWFTLFTAA